MKNLFLFLILLTAVSFQWSCSKPSSSQAGYTISDNGTSNGTYNATLNMNIYTSLNDYKNSTNVFLQATLSPGSIYTIPLSKLTSGQWYYVDLYSSDYTYTNWNESDDVLLGYDSTTFRRFKYVAGGNTNFEVAYFQTYMRISLLSENKPSTTWIAYDALDLSSNNSIWSTLTQDQQYGKLIFNKDHTGVYYGANSGDTTATYFTFSYDGFPGYPQYTFLPDQSGLLFSGSNTTVNPNTYVAGPTTIDTIEALMNGQLYLLSKQ